MDPETQPRNKDYFLPTSIIIAAVMISASIIYLVRSGNHLPAQPAQVAGTTNPAPAAVTTSQPRDVILGDRNAPVTLIEYGDYQCPFCGRFFTDTELPLRTKYIQPGKVKMVFRNFAFLGPESVAAGAAAECAKDQSQFWAYHDLLYAAEIKDGSERNGNLNRALFLQLAGQLKLDTTAFTTCLDGKKYDAAVAQETTDAQALGVAATPTVFVNSQKIEGAQPLAQFVNLIDSLLAGK